MLSLKTNRKLASLMTVACVFAGMMLYGCQSSQNPPAAGASAAPTTQPATFALFGLPPKKTGVQLWAENCTRCHNSRPTDEFSASQWAAVVHHMRLRANLTGEEQREITAFLQASN